MRCLVAVPLTTPLECLLRADFYLPPPSALGRATDCHYRLQVAKFRRSSKALLGVNFGGHSCQDKTLQARANIGLAI